MHIVILICLVTLMLLQLPLSLVAQPIQLHATPQPLPIPVRATIISPPTHLFCASIAPPKRPLLALLPAKQKPQQPWLALPCPTTYLRQCAPDTSSLASPIISSAWVSSATMVARLPSTNITCWFVMGPGTLSSTVNVNQSVHDYGGSTCARLAHPPWQTTPPLIPQPTLSTPSCLPWQLAHTICPLHQP